MTNTENANPETIEAITGLIRYGYQEAIDEIKEFISCGGILTFPTLMNKLQEMENTKKQINLDKLKKEIPE